MLKQVTYGVVGFMASGLLLVGMLTDMPDSHIPKSTITEFLGAEQKPVDEIPEHPHGTGDETVQLFTTYHMDEAEMANLKDKGVASFGRTNPMYYWNQTDTAHEGSAKYTWEDVEDEAGTADTEALGYNTKAQGGDDQIINVDTKVVAERIKEKGVLPVDDEFYNFSSHFGPREDPLNGRTDVFHTGLDISAASIDGANVYSILPGIITHIGDDALGFGHYVIVDHDGFTSLYAHLKEKPSISVEDTVNAGDVIGKVGTTGRSTGPHLHLEIEVDGVKIDPLGLLKLVK